MSYDFDRVDDILRGYEQWRDQKRANMEMAGLDHFGVSEYLDEYRKVEALRMISELRSVYADDELTWQEVDARVREILGIVQQGSY